MRNFWQHLTDDESGFTLVELMVVVAIIAILAGLAISQFGSTVQSAKSAEAEKFMKKVSQGAKTYYQTEQKCCGGKTGCTSPWHSCSPAGGPAGASVYPGGTGFSMKLLTAVPESGSKLQPKSDSDFNDTKQAALRRLGVELEDPLYFQYTYETGSSTNEAATATITAEANFDPSGSNNHTVTQTLGVEDGDPQVGTAFTTHEGK